ncbi:hypothetical protein [Nonomuraea typhae]|uniref:hypothetical protein n=1 Tax=Nonomuraea typhae TaxID=2603600 RepID=UPI0012FB32E2|nr:hypothetical protein [Nonomuraea typhae]
MNKIVSTLGALLIGTLAATAPAVSASASATVTKCSAWKPVGDRYLQSCVDVTGTQATTYGLVSSTSTGDVPVGVLSHNGATPVGDTRGTVHVAGNTVRFDGHTTTATAGQTIRATLYVPGRIGTGTLAGTDGATYCEPTLTGPAGPDGKRQCIEQITVWATVTG